MKEKGKNITIGILIILSITLIIVTTWLAISYRSKQDELMEYYKQQLEIKQQELFN